MFNSYQEVGAIEEYLRNEDARFDAGLPITDETETSKQPELTDQQRIDRAAGMFAALNAYFNFKG